MTAPIDERDSAIEAGWTRVENDGASVRAYAATPADATAATPHVVLAMHVYGVDSSQREVARRFAKDGFAVAIPDLYEQFGAPNGDGSSDHTVFMPFAKRLDFENVDPLLRAAAQWIKARHPEGNTAIAGFCMGGAMALNRAVGYSDIFSAVAVWYGAVRVDPAKVDIPVVASYGALDHGIPIDGVEEFQRALTVPNDIAIYPNAAHAFFDRERAAFEPAAAEDSWRRTIAFLHNHSAC